ncbi:hypothetical protein M422DRAFT_240256 [Sphaerobolus stellatus SS14]|nr:hypothetical protein M422DRAFT_240256 [Sphaerobolus stellatus SS14]
MLVANLDGRYDIVSWDPQGITVTTPRHELNVSTPKWCRIELYNFHASQETGLEFWNGSDSIDLAVFTAQV